MTREALLYERLPDGEVRCGLCAHRCRIRPGRRGICGVRENRAGVLHSLVYGNLIAENLDPIEKKPLFHVYPGSRAFSVATVGCNFRCTFCQNHDISQMPRGQGTSWDGRSSRSGSLAAAKPAAGPRLHLHGADGVLQYAGHRETGLVWSSRMSSYGLTMTAEAVAAVAPYLLAANVDLSFRDEFYPGGGARLSRFWKASGR